ncbi:hypothetical protein C8Q80DRAFT_1267002 [Daedaleopsis nitida]|nr:hypothetical protein C8Q80DRAFT_1267002 [Daedaleopsis nitida]
MFVNVHNLTVCEPVNVTWSGGVPPYRLDIVPFNGSEESALDQRFVQIFDTHVQYTPNRPPGTMLQMVLMDSNTNALDGSRSIIVLILPGPDTRCLTSSSTSPSAPSTSPTPSPSVAPSSSGTVPAVTISGTTQPVPDASSVHHGLSAGAIAGIAVGVGLSALFLTAMAVWCFLRRRKSEQYRKDNRRSLAESTFSETSTAVGHGRFLSLSNTVAASALTKDEFSPTDATYSGPSSPTLDAEEAGLRPIPYLVSQSEASPRTSTTDLRKGRKGAVTSITSMSSLATSTTNVSSADGGVRVASPRAIRFEVDAEGRVVPEVDESAMSEMSETAGSTLPPPYASYEH